MPYSQSILLITDNPLTGLATDYNLNPNSLSIDDLWLQSDTTIGIDAIREAKRFAASPPVMRPQKQIAVIAAETLTLEAQNAFLKLLEEPPPYLRIILAATSAHQLLDTIISRCQVINIKPTPPSAAPTDLLTHILGLAPVDRLELLPSTTTRDAAINYCQQLIDAASLLLKQTPNPWVAINLEILLTCHDHLSHNTNPSLTLTDAILRLNQVA